MALQRKGELTLGEICGGIALLIPMLQLHLRFLNGKLFDLQANLKVSLGINIPNPVELVFRLSELIKALPKLLIKLPSISVGIQADLNLKIAGLSLDIALIEVPLASLTAALNTGGIEAFTYSGPANQLGSELSKAVTDTSEARGVILLARAPSAKVALSSIFFPG